MGQAVEKTEMDPTSLDDLKSELISQVNDAADLDALEAARVSALGKKGRVTELMKGLGAMSPDERREMGQALNRLPKAARARVACEDGDAARRRQSQKHRQGIQPNRASRSMGAEHDKTPGQTELSGENTKEA